MKPRERVEKIINDLFEFGVPVELLFDVDDLLKSNNIPKVVQDAFICPILQIQQIRQLLNKLFFWHRVNFDWIYIQIQFLIEFYGSNWKQELAPPSHMNPLKSHLCWFIYLWQGSISMRIASFFILFFHARLLKKIHPKA